MTELQSKVVKARKPHVCVWCGERIEVGESAQYRVYINEGDFQSDYLHPECNSAAYKVDDLEDGFDPYSFQRGSELEKGELVERVEEKG